LLRRGGAAFFFGMAIRVAIADDHPLIRSGLAAVIELEPDLELVGQAQDGIEAVALFRDRRPDVILMDLGMPGIGGVEAIRAIMREWESAEGAAGTDCTAPRIVALTVYAGDQDIRQALEAGAAGYLLKDMAGSMVVDAIRSAARGEPVLPPAVAARLSEFSTPVELSARELEVLALVAEGRRNRDIARVIGRSEETVRVHLKNILAKLGVGSRTEAVAVALKRGILHQP
jgi:two-component system, NarL family, response regulator